MLRVMVVVEERKSVKPEESMVPWKVATVPSSRLGCWLEVGKWKRERGGRGLREGVPEDGGFGCEGVGSCSVLQIRV